MPITLESLYANCVEVGDCMEWQGYMTSCKGSTPQVFDPEKVGTWRFRPARRAVHELVTGRSVPRNMRCTTSCGNSRCIAAEHIVTKTPKQALVDAIKQHGRREAVVKLTQHMRSLPVTKLDMDKAREIRASDEPSHVLAQRYGVSKSRITEIKRGEAWRELVRGASVFSL